MLQMNKHYELEFKKKIVRLHLEEGRSLKSLLLNTAYRMQVFQIGQINSTTNAKQMKKPKPITLIR